MMDLSDGLAADLPRLAAESGVGAQVNLADLPVSADVPDRDPASALMDGEDYELLFSVPRDRAADWTLAFEKEFGISVCRMGEILPAGNGLVIVAQDGMDRDWPEGGYKHF
jgi:thiamine-monophosphate kinase